MKNYEISIWEDIANGSGIFQERKIAVIGSDSMTSEARAFDPILVRNINGTHTLTFKMYYICNDFSLDGMEKGFEKYNNPFISLMVNERKVKLHWKDKWYDFIIKNCQEDSNGKSVTYTCKDLFLNELGKTGFNLEFDNELLNNSGTISELGARVLEGTDWKISGSQGIILQEHEEPVYETASIKANFTGTKDGTSTTRSFTTSNSILLFHSCVPTIDDDGNLQGGAAQCQFLFTTDSSWQTELNKMLVINADCYSTPTGTWSKYVDSSHPENSRFRFSVNNTVIIDLPLNALVSNNYRGTRLVKAQKQEIDKVLNRSVYVYTDTTNPSVEYWGYPATEFNKPTLVNNLFVNYENFSSVEGWNGLDTFRLYPLMQEYTGAAENYEATSYLKINASSTVVNRGLQDTYMSFSDGFIKGEKYIFRYKAKANASGNVPGSYVTTNVFTPRVASYDTTAETPTPDTDYFSFDLNSWEKKGDWIEIEGTCTTSIPKHEIVTGIGSVTTKLGLFLVNSNAIRWLEKVEFFRKVMGLNASNQEVRINPGEISTRSVGEIYYNYYLPGQEVSDPSEIVYAYHNTVEWDQVTPAYRDNPFEEVRSITAKNSNRFNLLQTIAESFDCYCEFIIEHNDDGSIQYTTSAPIEAKKYVKFVRDIGQDNGLSFTYGLDLKSISRTIASDQIVTKMIVPKNSNSFGTNGFCTIARCDENYPRVNYILNFDYYISHGMIDGSELNRDLYSSVDIDMGYYYNLHRYNVEYDEITEKLTKRNSELTEQLAYQTTYSEALESTIEELNRCKDYLIRFCGVEDMAGVIAFIKRYPDDAELNARNINYNRLLRQRDNYNSLLSSVATSVGLLQNDIDTYTARQEQLKDLILALDKEFYTKYSRYIQEGSWNSEDYYDDLDYYLDAVNVCYTSSRPQVSYNINVMRLSEIEEYQNRKFELGDICYIQDTEFFGYVQNADFRTPYKEKVLISEVSEALDDPTRNTFKVQNYKTQFEDLFQRITATTQSLQYKEGEYSRAASVVTTERTIDADVIQNSIAANEQLVISAQNESIYQDNTGITLIDNTNPDHRLKITSYGIFVTDDGVWRNALRGDGVVTEMLSAGNINTNKIVISDGVFPAFRWDSTGINAYQQLYDTQDPTQKIGVDLSTSVRFDHFGLYGIKNVPDGSFIPTSEDQIWDNTAAKFGLTWKGFFLRTNNDNGRIEISSDKDFTISQKNGNTWYERVKIGRLSTDQYGNPSDSLYGIRISDLSGSPVLETVADGELWLRKALHISNTTGTNYNIAVGYLNGIKPNTSIHEVFNANNAFIVYEDGSIKGTNVEFTGGKIGNMTIEDITHQGIIAKISASADTFYDATPASITLTASLSDSTITPRSYQWTKNGTSISGATSATYVVGNNAVVANTSTLYSVTIKYRLSGDTTDRTATASILINKIPEPEIPDVDQYLLRTSQPEILIFNGVNNNNETYATFSPETINFWVEKEQAVVPLTDYSIEMNLYTTDVSLGTISDVLHNSNYTAFANKVIQNNDNTYTILLAGENGFVNLTGTLTEQISRLISLFKEGGVFIQIILYKDSKSYGYVNIPVRFGTTSDMATFSLYSGGIISAIQNTGLKFNVDGLTITNGGFKIVTQENGQDPVDVFYVSDDTHSLYMKGTINADAGYFAGELRAASGTFSGSLSAANGTFTGTLSGATGNFSGSIVANSGNIGGFAIDGQGIYSTDANQSLALYGTTGKIIANDIELGNNAKIQNYIQVGNFSYIKNPAVNNGVFIESEGIKIVEREGHGVLFLGDHIVADGNLEVLYGDTWSIGPGKAIFNNIDVTGTIHTSVFETGTVQAVGGNFLFRESAKIIANGTTSITLENISIANQFIPASGETTKIYITGVNSDGITLAPIIRTITTGNNATGVLTCDQSVAEGYNIIIKLATATGSGTAVTLSNNLVIGVNSTSVKAPFLYPKGFTFSAPDVLNSGEAMAITQAPNLFLGDLSSLVGVEGVDINFQSNDNKYGLYGDNVFLKGTLTTKVGNNSYAGINTVNGVTSTFMDHTSERIVFWAGAANNSTTSIQEAPFQVTEEGFVYGSNARFTGTIIADSYIDAAELYTPKIYGGRQGENNAAELSIYDANNGIIFYDTRGSNANEILRISPNELSFYGKPFIRLNGDNTVDFIADNLGLKQLTITNNNKSLKILENQLAYYNVADSPSPFSAIIFNDGQNPYIDLAEKLLIYSNKVESNVDSTVIKKNLSVGDVDNYGKLNYVQTADGYELYVEE